MNIGITGHKGFIGRHIVESLANKNIKISGFDLPENNILDLDNLKKFVRDKDIIIHTATVNRGSNTEVIASSVVGTYNLVTAIKKKTRLIFTSSIQAERNNVYGSSKRLAEKILEDYSKNNNSPVTVFRITNVFGEGCAPLNKSVVSTFCYQAINNQKMIIKDDTISLIHIKDLVKIIVAEIDKKRQGYYCKKITTNNLLKIKELAEIITSFKNIDPKKIKSKFHKDLYKTYLSYEQ